MNIASIAARLKSAFGFVSTKKDPVTGGGDLFSGAKNLGITSIPLRSSFADVIGSAAPVKQYIFGTGAVASQPYQIAIKSVADLPAYFNAYEDGTQHTTINGELQTYMPFNSTNHVFTADRLNLTPRLLGGQWPVQVTNGSASGVKLDGTANTLANLGLANTNGLRIGQLVAVQYKGIYYISAIVTNTSVSLTSIGGSSTSTQYQFLIAWLPIDSAPLTAVHADGTADFVFGAGLPAAVTNGMSVYLGYSSSIMARNADWRVQSIDVPSGTVTLNQATSWGALSIGQRVIFSPTIESGQIWTTEKFDLTDPDIFIAMELDCELMTGSRDYQIKLVNTSALFAAVPSDVPWGAWPAFWLFGADDDGVAPGYSSSAAEIDILEMYWSSTNGPCDYSGGNLGLGAIKNVFLRSNGWTTSGSINVSPTSLAGPRKIQFIYKNGRTYRYVDGVLTKADVFDWASQRLAQLGLNLAVGGVSTGNAANFLFPMSPQSLASQVFGIKSLKVWKF